jgi:hypothetical protein
MTMMMSSDVRERAGRDMNTETWEYCVYLCSCRSLYIPKYTTKSFLHPYPHQLFVLPIHTRPNSPTSFPLHPLSPIHHHPLLTAPNALPSLAYGIHTPQRASVHATLSAPHDHMQKLDFSHLPCDACHAGKRAGPTNGCLCGKGIAEVAFLELGH